MEKLFSSIFSTFEFDNIPGVDTELLNKLNDWMVQSEKERIAKAKTEWEETRKSFEWTLEEYKHTKEFDNKYQNAEGHNYYILKNNKRNTYFELFDVYSSEIKNTEKKLNSERYVELNKCYEDRYSDDIMESCHGKNWKTKDERTGKPASPYHIATYSVIFDTHTGEIIYEANKSVCYKPYIHFYDNVAEIIQGNNKTVYFNLPERKMLAEGDYEKIESIDYIALGVKSYIKKKEPIVVINKHTCEISLLN